MAIFGRNRRGSAVGRQRRGRAFRAGVEALEGKALLTGSGATIVLAGGIIEVLGTNLGDTGSVNLQSDGRYHVHMANTQGSDDVAFPASQVSAVYYVGGAGNNSFTNATSLTGYLYGGSGSNVLTGGSGVDYLVAWGSGTQVLNAGSGYEVLEAVGPGTATLNGGSGTDVFYATAGVNTIHGGSGVNSIISYGGRNTIDGGTGYSYVYSYVSTDVITSRPTQVVYHLGY
jgi:Ca2+-binding RTX toxin-like protein